MNLDEFVKNSIVNVVTGINEAEKIVSKKGAHVNPLLPSTDGPERTPRSMGPPYHLMKFDVAITDSREGSASAEAGVKSGALGVFLGFSAKAGGSVSKGSENLSRIEFEIPISYPLPEARWKKKKRDA